MSTETRTMSVATTLIETDEARDDWMRESDVSYCFVLAPHSEHYVAFCTEDGDWYATRPINEDDQAEDGSFPDGVTVSFEGLDLPLTILYDPSAPASAPSVVPEAAVPLRPVIDGALADALGDTFSPSVMDDLARRVHARVSAALPPLTAAQSEVETCAWCPSPARGSARHNDGRMYPSCGEADHGQGWAPGAVAQPAPSATREEVAEAMTTARYPEGGPW